MLQTIKLAEKYVVLFSFLTHTTFGCVTKDYGYIYRLYRECKIFPCPTSGRPKTQSSIQI